MSHVSYHSFVIIQSSPQFGEHVVRLRNPLICSPNHCSCSHEKICPQFRPLLADYGLRKSFKYARVGSIRYQMMGHEKAIVAEQIPVVTCQFARTIVCRKYHSIRPWINQPAVTADAIRQYYVTQSPILRRITDHSFVCKKIKCFGKFTDSLTFQLACGLVCGPTRGLELRRRARVLAACIDLENERFASFILSLDYQQEKRLDLDSPPNHRTPAQGGFWWSGITEHLHASSSNMAQHSLPQDFSLSIPQGKTTTQGIFTNPTNSNDQIHVTDTPTLRMAVG